MPIKAQSVFDGSAGKYFRISDGFDTIGVVAAIPQDSGYSWICYDSGFNKALPLNIDWLMAVKQTAPEMITGGI